MASTVLILVVDDSPIQRQVCSNTLQVNGYSVILAEDGRQGVDMALQHHPDLILMDITMPVMDGLSAVRELRTRPEMIRVPILALTATSDSKELAAAYQAGYSGVVNKSDYRSALLDAVRQWTSHTLDGGSEDAQRQVHTDDR
jgi:two-component system, cell cycle response regulator DivK